MAAERRNNVAKRIGIVFLIRSLQRGGAERQLVMLATRLDPAMFDVSVVTFYPGGPLWDELRDAGAVRIVSLNKRGRWDNVASIRRLVALLKQYAPDILHSYLVEPSVIGLIAARLASVPLVVWGVRASNMDYSRYERINRWTFRLAAMLSPLADLIIANSDAGSRYHQQRGYRAKRIYMIPNGIDTTRFRPRPEVRISERERLGIVADEIVIGMSARIDPMKGYLVFLGAAAALHAAGMTRFRFVCAGGGKGPYRDSVHREAVRLGLGNHLLWIEDHDAMESLYQAFDIGCSASLFGEGFSNSIGEAMACGVPCVVTDVGDSARIVGETGFVSRPTVDGLTNALMKMATLSAADRAARGDAARARIVERFDVMTMVRRTEEIYLGVVEQNHARPAAPEPC